MHAVCFIIIWLKPFSRLFKKYFTYMYMYVNFLFSPSYQNSIACVEISTLALFMFVNTHTQNQAKLANSNTALEAKNNIFISHFPSDF